MKKMAEFLNKTKEILNGEEFEDIRKKKIKGEDPSA